MNRVQATAFAKRHAKSGDHDHEYGITSWVLDAIQAAYDQGQIDGYNDSAKQHFPDFSKLSGGGNRKS